jgi:2-keto-3-deoxy-L-rhamnonate aldolase RhmA
MTVKNPHNRFRQRLLGGDLLIGTFVKTPSMMLAEVLAQTELDVVCIDAEHSPFDRRDIDASVLAYRAANKPSLVRVPSSAPEQILNALDCGATGIVIPHVDTADKAKACAAASRFGDGGRGYAGSTRAAAYGGRKIAENLQLNQDENTVIAQIEDLAALNCIDEIAAVKGIDCLFIGMMDLTVALGADNAKDPAVIEAAEKICRAAQSADRRLGIFVPDVADIPFWRERGVSLFLLASDHAFIRQGAATLVAAAKKHCGP